MTTTKACASCARADCERCRSVDCSCCGEVVVTVHDDDAWDEWDEDYL